jgi:hypothetical protein
MKNKPKTAARQDPGVFHRLVLAGAEACDLVNPDVMPPTACVVVGVFIVLFVIAFALKKWLANLTDRREVWLMPPGGDRLLRAAREARRIFVASLDRPMSRDGRVES